MNNNNDVIIDNKNNPEYQNLEYSQFDQIDALCKDDGSLLRGIFAYGFEIPSLIQSKAILPIAEGKDLIAQSQSGTGKTAAFAIGLLSRINPKDKCVQGIIIANTKDLAMQTFNVAKHMYVMEYVKTLHFMQYICIFWAREKTQARNGGRPKAWACPEPSFGPGPGPWPSTYNQIKCTNTIWV